MHSDTAGYSQSAPPPETRSDVPGPKFIRRHTGPNRAQRRKLAKLWRTNKDDAWQFLAGHRTAAQIRSRIGLLGNGDRSRLVRR